MILILTFLKMQHEILSILYYIILGIFRSSLRWGGGDSVNRSFKKLPWKDRRIDTNFIS